MKISFDNKSHVFLTKTNIFNFKLIFLIYLINIFNFKLNIFNLFLIYLIIFLIIFKFNQKGENIKINLSLSL